MGAKPFLKDPRQLAGTPEGCAPFPATLSGDSSPFIEAILGRYLPDSTFTRLMEEMLEKDDPTKVIGWPTVPIPPWARQFRPSTFIDLGCGLGGFTTSVLTRLAQWGCLSELKRVVLIDRDGSLHSNGPPGLKQFLERRIASVLSNIGLSHVIVEAHVRELRLIRAADGTADLSPLEEICPAPDFILASHLTYYFDDGSGSRLVDAVVRHRLPPHGRLWVNIRDLNCPAYRNRAEVLRAIGIDEPQPFDYAEHFSQVVLPSLNHAKLVDERDVAVPLRPGANRERAASLIMWRAEVEGANDVARAMVQAAAHVAAEWDCIYSETQFILTQYGQEDCSGRSPG